MNKMNFNEFFSPLIRVSIDYLMNDGGRVVKIIFWCLFRKEKFVMVIKQNLWNFKEGNQKN